MHLLQMQLHGAVQVVPGKGPNKSMCRVFLSEERPGAEARTLSAVEPGILQVCT